MSKRVFIVHGWEGMPDIHWLPWLKVKLEARGTQVVVPAMPDTVHPDMTSWLDHLRPIVGIVDEGTYFVGHSLGCITIFRLLAGLPAGQIAGGVVTVAGFSESIGYEELASFFATPLDYTKVRSRAKQVIAINSDNDKWVPLEQGRQMEHHLGAKLVVVPSGGHLTSADGFSEFPLLLDEVLGLIGE